MSRNWRSVQINTPTGTGNIIGTSGAAASVELVAPGPTVLFIYKHGANTDTITITSDDIEGSPRTFNLTGTAGAAMFPIELRLRSGITALSLDTQGAAGTTTFVTARD